LRVKYKTLEEAEMNFGLSIDAILQGATVPETPSKVCPVSFLSKLGNLTSEQLLDVTKECLQLLQPQHLANVLSESLLQHAEVINMESVIMPTFSASQKKTQFGLMDQMFARLSSSCGINAKLSNFISLSIEAMISLQNAGKSNLIYKWAKCIVGEDGKPLMQLNRMPFELIEYQMEFFTATNIMQVCILYICNLNAYFTLLSLLSPSPLQHVALKHM
jgi:hypothetical protein